MSYSISMLEGYGAPPKRSTNKRSPKMKLGTAAKQCKGKKGASFRKCVVAKVKGFSGYSKKRRSHR